MKIHVKSDDQNISLILPTNLVLSAPIAWIADRAISGMTEKSIVDLPPQAANAVAKLPPDAVKKLFSELRRIKRRYGKWTLVEMDSRSGDQVLVEL